MKKSKKTSKSLFIIIVAYCSVVLLVASFLLSSSAKYRAKINGQTNAHDAQLNGALLESLTSTDGGTTYEQAPLGSGSDLVLWGLYPGMSAREYAFVVSNGTDTDTHATVDMEFSVLLRTMENLPLKYTLVCGESEYPAQTSPYPTAIADEHKQTSDTDWHVYTFFEKYGSAREATFRLTGTDLAIQSLKIRVEWPIITDTNVSKTTNDASYMNEVEIVNVLIKLNSAIYVDVPVTPVIDDDDVTTVGVIVLTPNLVGGVLSATSTDVSYDVSYDAFRLKDDGYRYDFEVTNGNRMRYNGINVTTYTDYSVSVKIPVSYYTQNMSTMKLAYRDAFGTEQILQPTKTDYFKYDILQSSAGYGNFVTVSASDVPTYESATDTDLQYRIYKVYTYDIPAADARLLNLNVRTTDTDAAFAAFDYDVLTLICENNVDTAKLMTGDPDDRIDTVQRRLQILIQAVFNPEE